jgi:hypothetical protein
VLRSRNIGLSAPVIVCNAEHRFIIAEQLREIGVTDATIVLEPEGRNSAPAVAAAAFFGGGTGSGYHFVGHDGGCRDRGCAPPFPARWTRPWRLRPKAMWSRLA